MIGLAIVILSVLVGTVIFVGTWLKALDLSYKAKFKSKGKDKQYIFDNEEDFEDEQIGAESEEEEEEMLGW